MAEKDLVAQFVRDALLAGRSRTEIREALGAAGWSEREVREALSGFADIDFTPPVPRPRPHLTERDVFIYALLYTARAFTAAYLVTLIHSILDLKMPSPTDKAWKSLYATRQVRWAIATLAVSAPVFIWMTIYTGRRVHEDASLRRSPVRKWLTYLALFVSALIFLGDASYVIYSFLQGELTLRFALKAATVLVVSGGIFAFYLHDVGDPKNEP